MLYETDRHDGRQVLVSPQSRLFFTLKTEGKVIYPVDSNTNHILHFFGKTHAEYLHARGKIATEKVIEILDPQPDESILEIGCGTGATLVRLASEFRNVQFHGYELSEVMYKKAIDRIRFCRLKDRIRLVRLESKKHLSCS